MGFRSWFVSTPGPNGSRGHNYGFLDSSDGTLALSRGGHYTIWWCRSPFHGVSLGTKGRTRMVGFGPIVLDFWWRSMSISWDIMNNERQCPEFSYCISISGGFTGHYWYLFLDSYSKKEIEDESLVWINLRRRSARSPSGHV